MEIKRLIVASGNPKKLKELQRIMSDCGVEVLTPQMAGFNMDSVEETGETFKENARIKALAAFERSGGLNTVADDSGLCVDCLDGAPGVYSARFAGEGATDKEKCTKLLNMMSDIPEEKRSAKFVSNIYAVINGREYSVEGICEGRIGFEPKGENGFGYDPVFYVENGKSFAELSDEQKDEISHRGRALRAFKEIITQLINE